MSVIFDHVALAAARIDLAPDFIVGTLGGKSGFGGPAGPYRFWHWDFPGPGRIEVLEPMGPPGGFVHRFLEQRGPGIHHVTFKVPSLRDACARAEAQGYAIVGFDDSEPHWQEAFLHPKQAMGIVVQMVESRPHPEGTFSSRAPRDEPPSPDSPPAPVEVVGVRMRSGSRERALRQWGEVLGGEVALSADELCFSWPGSGMRVAVTLRDGADDASLAIEVRSDRPLSLPDGPHPVLGAEFRQVS